MYQSLHPGCTKPACDIFFHIPKTAGQTFHNLLTREYRSENLLNTHCGVLSESVWDDFLRRTLSEPDALSSCRAATGHMKFGLHEVIPGPSRYLTFLRNPVRRFTSYYTMLRRRGLIPAEHQIDPSLPDWNLSAYESALRELDNGQTRALANADWDLPFGQCTEAHLAQAMAHLDHYFAFVGVTEHFDLSLLLLGRLCGWRWHFYVKKNVTPALAKPELSSHVLSEIDQLNRFDRQLHLYATEKLLATASQYGLSLSLERGAYATANTLHRGFHHVRFPLRHAWKRWKKKKSQSVMEEADASVQADLSPDSHMGLS